MLTINTIKSGKKSAIALKKDLIAKPVYKENCSKSKVKSNKGKKN